MRKIIDSYKFRSYHLSHKRSALEVLKNIEKQRGKTNKKLIVLSNDYANDVFGWVGYAPWLYVYSAINNEFKEGWIPDNYYGKIVVPSLKGNYGSIADYNSLQGKLFNSENFPDRVYYANGLWMSTKYEVLTEQDVKQIVFEKSERAVFKIDNSLQGKGVYFFDKTKIDLNHLKTLGNGVLQSFINQHEFFENIISNSVATLRLTSVINEKGEVSIRACYLRVGQNTDTHVRSASHIRIPVNIENGELDEVGYNTSWNRINKHPQTDFLFKNKKIPHFNKFIQTSINLHKMVPFTRIIGWDMILDKNHDIQVMEWNGSHNDIKFSEATQGPCFSDLSWENL